MYDYLVVGAGLFGSVFAREMTEAGKKVLIIDKRDHIGGNAHTKNEHGIQVHVYGPHIFHTNNQRIWDYVNRFAEFNHYQHKGRAFYKGKIYSLPFNMNTFYQLWGCISPEDAEEELKKQLLPVKNPQNLEEWALSKVGRDIYQKLIYGYTKKQWQRFPKELPASIIKRLPIRMIYDDNYFNDPFQGIPKKGYTHMIGNIIDGIDVKLNEDFFERKKHWKKIAKKLVYSGPIDQFFKCKYGWLNYRSLKFENEIVDGNFQGCSVVNYTDKDVPWTRIVEHQHFLFELHEKSIITREYSLEWKPGLTPYYPINDEKNMEHYAKYKALADKETHVIFGGRLGTFKYLDMDQVIGQALNAAKREIQ